MSTYIFALFFGCLAGNFVLLKLQSILASSLTVREILRHFFKCSFFILCFILYFPAVIGVRGSNEFTVNVSAFGGAGHTENLKIGDCSFKLTLRISKIDSPSNILYKITEKSAKKNFWEPQSNLKTRLLENLKLLFFLLL